MHLLLCVVVCVCAFVNLCMHLYCSIHPSFVYSTYSPCCRGITPPTIPPVATNLSCTSYSNNNGLITYECTFSSGTNCAPNNFAAVECSKCVCTYIVIFYQSMVGLYCAHALPVHVFSGVHTCWMCLCTWNLFALSGSVLLLMYYYMKHYLWWIG